MNAVELLSAHRKGGGDALPVRPTMIVSGTDPMQRWQQRVVDRSLGRATQRSIDRGAELIFAAATLLEKSNGDNFTVQDVADTANQSLRTLYAHFGGKDDLLLAVLEEAMNAFARIITEAVEAFEDPQERLAAAIYFASRLWERAPHGANIGLARLQAKLAETAPEQLAAAQAPVTTVFSELLDHAMERATAPPLHLDAAVYLVLSLVHALGRTHVMGNEYGLVLPAPQELVEFCLRSLGIEPRKGWESRFERRWAEIPTHFSVAEDLKPASVNRKTAGRKRASKMA